MPHLNNLYASCRGRQMKWSHSFVVFRVDVRACVEQNLHSSDNSRHAFRTLVLTLAVSALALASFTPPEGIVTAQWSAVKPFSSFSSTFAPCSRRRCREDSHQETLQRIATHLHTVCISRPCCHMERRRCMDCGLLVAIITLEQQLRSQPPSAILT